MQKQNVLLSLLYILINIISNTLNKYTTIVDTLIIET